MAHTPTTIDLGALGLVRVTFEPSGQAAAVPPVEEAPRDYMGPAYSRLLQALLDAGIMVSYQSLIHGPSLIWQATGRPVREDDGLPTERFGPG